MAVDCNACARFVAGKGSEPNMCVRERTDIKGGRFWTARPAGEKKTECREFEARPSESSKGG